MTYFTPREPRPEKAIYEIKADPISRAEWTRIWFQVTGFAFIMFALFALGVALLGSKVPASVSHLPVMLHHGWHTFLPGGR